MDHAHTQEHGESESRDDKVGRLTDDVDHLLDEISDKLDSEAEEFVRGFIQKGGQGWSSFLDPAFFIGAATASLVAGVAWDAFKVSMAKSIHALRHVQLRNDTPIHVDEGSGEEVYDDDFVHVLSEAWDTAQKLLASDVPSHTVDEATALHWALFMTQLQARAGLVRIAPEQREQLKAAAAGLPNTSPSALLTAIIGEWFDGQKTAADDPAVRRHDRPEED